MLKQDLIFASRLFRREPLTVLVTVGGLALAIAVSTSVFSILNAAALRPIGVKDPAAAVHVWRDYRNGATTIWSYDEYRRLRAAARLSRVEAFIRETGPFAATPEEQGVATDVHLVAGSLFSTFDGGVAIGRALTERDDVPGAPVVAVVSYGFWKRALGGDRSAVGRTVYFFGKPVTIIGIAERRFTGPSVEVPAFWLPLAPAGSVWSSVGPLDPGSTAPVSVNARLAANVTLQVAQSELASLAAVHAVPSPDATRATTGARLVPADNRGETRTLVAVVMAGVALVLLLACANVANLLLASASARSREISMRMALGAGRARIARQLLTESLLLSVAAGALGLLAVVWVLPLILTLVHVPDTADVSPEGRVYAFAVLVAIVTGVLAGLAPAHAGSRRSLLAALGSDSAHAGTPPRLRRLRSCFVGAQAAASVVLLVLAALLTRAERHVSQRDLGFDVERLVAVSPGFAGAKYDAGRATQFWEAALARVESLPGVESAALSEHLPFGGSTESSTRAVGNPFRVHVHRTSDSYFSTTGIRLVAGRTYTETEAAAGAPVAIVSQSVAREFWGAESPLGDTLRRVRSGLAGMQVIGVAEDVVRSIETDSMPSGIIYQPIGRDRSAASLIVRSSADPVSLIGPLRASLLSIDPALTPNPWLLRNGLAIHLKRVESLSALGTVAGVLALALAVTGIFGVTAFVISRRGQEIAIRMALGGSRNDVIRLLTRDAMRPVVAGLAAGVLVALFTTGVLSAVLYGVSPRDPLSIGVAAAVLLGAAYAAVILPARRATRAHPGSLLRQQ